MDLAKGTISIVRALVKPGAKPEFGPTKTGRARTVSISAETVALLRVHKKHQAEIRMANRTTYHEHGLVFAKEWVDVRRKGETLGQPLQANNIGQREYAQVIKAANVRRIKFHGLRHTCATLLLQAGVPVHVVAQRLGHKKAEMTLEVYGQSSRGISRRLRTRWGRFCTVAANRKLTYSLERGGQDSTPAG